MGCNIFSFHGIFCVVIIFFISVALCDPEHNVETIPSLCIAYEPRHEKAGFLHNIMRKQRRRSASR